MLNKWINKWSVQRIRQFSFVLGLLFYVISSLLSFKSGSYARVSRFLDLLALWSLIFAFSYKTKEENLKLHSWIEQKIKGQPARIFLIIALISTILTLTGAFFSFRHIYQLGYNSQENLVVQRVLVVFLFLTSSFWERRKALKSTTSS